MKIELEIGYFFEVDVEIAVEECTIVARMIMFEIVEYMRVGFACVGCNNTTSRNAGRFFCVEVCVDVKFVVHKSFREKGKMKVKYPSDVILKTVGTTRGGTVVKKFSYILKYES